MSAAGPTEGQGGARGKETRQHEGVVEGLNEYGEGWLSVGDRVLKLGRSCPGDRVKLAWQDPGKRFVRAELVELLKPSAERRDPGCEAFREGCGGCQWLHVDYQRQLAEKQRIVGDFINHRARLRVKVQPVLGHHTLGPAPEQGLAPVPRAFRNKMSLTNVDGRLAFLREYSSDPVVPRECLVETPANQAAWELLRQIETPPEVLQVHLRSAGSGLGVCLFVKRLTQRAREFALELQRRLPGVSGVGAASYRDYQLVAGEAAVVQELGGIGYRIPLNGFFQTNYEQALVLRELALAWLSPGKDDRVLDLYCGAGFFSLALAQKAAKVIGIEENADSVASARENAALNGLDNLRFVAADAQRGLAALRPGDISQVLLDPPREGCDPQVLRSLSRLRPQRIAYVSCSPETLGRDLRLLVDNGYRLEYCQPVDMFPHTAHIEVLAGLVAFGRD